MMSVGFSSLPAIFLIASSSRVLSYVMSTAIDDGPLETMPNMSPSCTSSFAIFLNSSRTRPVLWNCRWRSSTKNRKMRPDTPLRGRGGGRGAPPGGGGGRARRRQDDPLGRGRRRRREEVVHLPAGDHGHRRDVLLHAVLVDLE